MKLSEKHVSVCKLLCMCNSHLLTDSDRVTQPAALRLQPAVTACQTGTRRLFSRTKTIRCDTRWQPFFFSLKLILNLQNNAEARGEPLYISRVVVFSYNLVLLAPNHSNMHLHGLTPGYGSKLLGNHSQSGTEAEEQITMHTAVYSEL